MGNPISGLIDRYRSWRYGGITGLNYFEQSNKWMAMVVGSWLVGYLSCFMFAPDPYLELSISVMSVFWIVGVALMVAYAKYNATNYRVFAQSVWHFPDGGKRKYDLMVDPDKGFSKEGDLYDEKENKTGEGWRINFEKRLQYWDKRSEFPFVFDYALWKLPKAPDECFQYLSIGEIFHKGVAIKTPSEHISVYVYGWLQDDKGIYIPLCAINDCSYAYSKALEDGEIALDDFEMKKDGKKLAFIHERRRRMFLERHAQTLEDMAEANLTDAKKYRKDVDKGIDTRRELVKTVLDTEKPLIQKIKENWFKIALIVIAVIVFLWFMGWI